MPFYEQTFLWKCYVHETTGLYCPGCGGTRAVLALLHGKPLLSFLYHPLVLYLAVLCAVFALRGALHLLSRGRLRALKLRLSYVYVGIGITLVQFAAKNACLLLFHVAYMD